MAQPPQFDRPEDFELMILISYKAQITPDPAPKHILSNRKKKRKSHDDRKYKNYMQNLNEEHPNNMQYTQNIHPQIEIGVYLSFTTRLDRLQLHNNRFEII